jgi:hypothetical protein
MPLVAATAPETNNSESPGSRGKITSPVSAKMTMNSAAKSSSECCAARSASV